MLASLAVVLVLAAVHLFSPALRVLREVPRSRVLSIAGGISVAFVVLRLLPSIAESQREHVAAGATGLVPFLRLHAYVVVLASMLLYYGLERLTKQSRKLQRAREGQDEAAPGVFWLHLSSFVVLNALIGYALVFRAGTGFQPLLLFGFAMILKFIVTDHGLHVDHKRAYDRRGRWVLAASVLGGWLLGTTLDLHPAVPALLQAFIAGGVLLNVLKEELPEYREGRYGAFVAGATAYAALLLAL